MKRILVTGATGFIASRCLRQLAAGNDEIHAAARRDLKAEFADRVRWHAVDLRDPATAAKLVTEIKPTHVLHAAWIATPGVYGHSPENMDWLAASLAMACAFGEAGGKRFVGVGTSAEYFPSDAPCLEDDTPIRPASVYGKCKAASWQGLAAAAQHHKYSVAWGRIFLPYGPSDAPARLIPSLISSLRAGKSLETTHGRQLRDFVYVDDVASFFVRLLESDEPGVFNIGTGVGMSVRTAIETLVQHLHADPGLPKFGARDFPASEPMMLVADMTKTREKLGWSPAVSFEQGIAKTLAAG